MTDAARIAYLSMEIALAPEMPTYAGGLGVLAGDTLRSCADLALPVVAVTLLYRQGYFRQHLDPQGDQSEEPERWVAESCAEALEPRAELSLFGRSVRVRAWRRQLRGSGGARVPVYLLDADLPENAPEDRALTGQLYGGDERYRLAQEALLGIGGVRMLRALGHHHLDRYHLNEGHAALAVLALLERRKAGSGDAASRLEAIRSHCVFTTHTPVPAGHDRFPASLVRDVLGAEAAQTLATLGQGAFLNLTDLALRCSHYVNGVAMRHGEVSRNLFPHYPIRSITNGIHPATWAAPSFRALFDRYVPTWRRDAFALRYAVGIPLQEIADAHAESKRALLERVERETQAEFRPDALTLGFARRATAYKRATLILHDPERLARLARACGPLQIVFAGKAHPRDSEGKALIRQVLETAEALRGRVPIAYLANHDMDLGRLLCAGADVWLNTPIPPLEASGTSGMKAALNGVPSLSVLDGWWVEGHVEGATGWSIGRDGFARDGPTRAHHDEHAEALYRKLADEVLPCFHQQPERLLAMRRQAIALNASFFNTQRMVLQYLYDAYLTHPAASEAPAAGDLL